MGEMRGSFKFEIGDIVVLATDMAAACANRSVGRQSGVVYPKQVCERRLQECHGGVNQGHYLLVGDSGVVPELGLVGFDEYVAEIDKGRVEEMNRVEMLRHEFRDLRQIVAGMGTDLLALKGKS